MRLGLVATPVAYFNYQQKKAAYDEAVAKYEQLIGVAQKAVDWYQQNLEDISDLYVGADEAGNYAQKNNTPDLKIDIRLQVGMLVGKKMKARAILTITNESEDKAYWINKLLLAQFTLMGQSFGYIAGVQNPREAGAYWAQRVGNQNGLPLAIADFCYNIRPGETATFVTAGTPFDMELLSRDWMDTLRREVCTAAGKSLITNVPVGTEIDGDAVYGVVPGRGEIKMLTAETDGYRYYMQNEKMLIMTRWQLEDVHCTLEYMGEAWSPNAQDALTIIGNSI